MTKRMFIMLGCVLALIAVIAFGYYLHIQKLIASSPKPTPSTVSTIKATLTEWQAQLSSSGTITAFRGVDVASEIAGLVRNIRFQSGQNVKKGDVLFELSAEADIANLNALEAQAELAAIVLKRDQAQLAAEGVSQAQVDADKADLKHKVALAQQQKAIVEKKLIRAPFAGRAGITMINLGQYVNPGDKLVSLQMIDPVYVNFFVPQKQIALLNVGQDLRISSDAFADLSFPGKVNAINPVVDLSSRNVQIQATLSNEKKKLLPGMFANVRVDVGAKAKFITLPQTAIAFNPYGATVFVVRPADKKENKGNAKLVAHQVFVTTGATRGDQIAVIKGVVEGEEVVTSGQLKLKTGSPVVVDNSVLPANNPNPTPQEH